MSEDLDNWQRDDWQYVPERDDPWMDEAIARFDAGQGVPHEEAMRIINNAIAEGTALHAQRQQARRRVS